MHERPAEPIKLPDYDRVKSPAPGVGHELIESWARGLGTADLVLVDAGQGPRAVLDVSFQFRNLNGVGLVCRRTRA